MTARLLIGDVFDRMADIPDSSVDLVLTSPPFLRLRSYLPDDHPKKQQEIGSEATPAEYLDVLLRLTAEWRRVLAPHGSLAVELGDTYASAGNKAGWPLTKSLCGIPTLYAWSLAYGRNLLTGEPSPAGMWRIRNIKPWIRSNPPVGALGDKERPATSYVIVACTSAERWFDLDAVRTGHSDNALRYDRRSRAAEPVVGTRGDDGQHHSADIHPAGAPPLDWWHEVDAVLDACLDKMAGKANGHGDRGVVDYGFEAKIDSRESKGRYTKGGGSTGARGVHLRRALEDAGILSTVDALDVTARGYKGAHYAVWPPELCRRLIAEMCPQQVCRTCGQPSRRITDVSYEAHGDPAKHNAEHKAQADYLGQQRQQNAQGMAHGRATKRVETLGWSDCGCPGDDRWRPGLILDPFAGSGTTLAVATDMERDAIGIDLDERTVELIRGRCASVDVGGQAA